MPLQPPENEKLLQAKQENELMWQAIVEKNWKSFGENCEAQF
jgi:hypothetical protein